MAENHLDSVPRDDSGVHLDPERYLEPARSVIERLGGVDKVAEITGKHRTRVFRWMYPEDRGGTGGLIPQRDQPKLLQHASRAGLDLSPADFFPKQQVA